MAKLKRKVFRPKQRIDIVKTLRRHTDFCPFQCIAHREDAERQWQVLCENECETRDKRESAKRDWIAGRCERLNGSGSINHSKKMNRQFRFVMSII